MPSFEREDGLHKPCHIHWKWFRKSFWDIFSMFCFTCRVFSFPISRPYNFSEATWMHAFSSLQTLNSNLITFMFKHAKRNMKTKKGASPLVFRSGRDIKESKSKCLVCSEQRTSCIWCIKSFLECQMHAACYMKFIKRTNYTCLLLVLAWVEHYY